MSRPGPAALTPEVNDRCSAQIARQKRSMSFPERHFVVGTYAGIYPEFSVNLNHFDSMVQAPSATLLRPLTKLPPSRAWLPRGASRTVCTSLFQFARSCLSIISWVESGLRSYRNCFRLQGRPLNPGLWLGRWQWSRHLIRKFTIADLSIGVLRLYRLKN